MKARGILLAVLVALCVSCAGQQIIKQTSLPWLVGQTVEVRLAGCSYNAEAIRGMAEESFRGRGAKVMGVSRYPSQQTTSAATLVAEIYLERRGQHALVEIRLIEQATGTVVAIGRGSSFINYWGTFSYSYGYATYYDELGSVEAAARLALNNLH